MNAPAAESPANLRRQTTRAAGGATGLGFLFDSSASGSASGFGATTLDVLAILSPLPSPSGFKPPCFRVRQMGRAKEGVASQILMLDPIIIIIIISTVKGHVVASDSLIKVITMCSHWLTDGIIRCV